MVQAVMMPKYGQTVTECTIVKWRKNEGDTVSEGDVLFEIETDKAVLEVESFHAGTLLKRFAAEGDTVPVQTVVGFIGEPGEAVPDAPPPAPVPEKPSPAPAVSVPAKPTAGQAIPSPAQKPSPSVQASPTPSPANVAATDDIFRISPRAAKAARDAVISVKNITGSGPSGRITESDVRNYLKQNGYDSLKVTASAKALAANESVDLLSVRGTGDGGRITVSDIRRAIQEKPVPLPKIRKIIAQRMSASYTTAPHFFVTISVDMTDLDTFRRDIKKRGLKISVTDFISQAVILTLKEFPNFNSSTDGETVRWHSAVNLGMAVALENGLVVPVLRHACELTLSEIHDKMRDLVIRAQSGKLTPDEMTGSTFTISNMGMLDVENFTAIINPGESAILAVSSVIDTPVVKKGEIVIRKMMKMTLSSDHRLIDGAAAARFINSVKRKLKDIKLWTILTS